MKLELNASKPIPAWRIAAALLPGLVAGLYLFIHIGPIPQPLDYHLFADTRMLHGIPNTIDVLSNVAYVVVGAFGLWALRQAGVQQLSFIDDRERRLYQWFYLGIFLTGFGSGWYHLAPDNYSLVWDRLPMTIAFMSIFSIMIAERISLPLGIAFHYPLMVIGIASVLLWIWSEHLGHGDLRFYLLIQFYPMITIALMLLFLPSKYTHGNDYWVLFLCYAAAKVVEVYDHEIFSATNEIISGHSLKHLLSSAGPVWLIWMLRARKPSSA